MARCTAPVQGHRTASGRASCPVCGGSYRGSYGGYNSYSSYSSLSNSSTSRSSGGGQTSTKARWSSVGSTILYTPGEIRTLTPGVCQDGCRIKIFIRYSTNLFQNFQS